MTEKKFTVGQQVWVTRSYSKPSVSEVVKVGRKYVTVGTGYSSDIYDMSDGRGRTGYDRIFTVDEWEERTRIDEIHAELRGYDIRPSQTSRFRLPLKVLEEILEVVRKAGANS